MKDSRPGSKVLRTIGTLLFLVFSLTGGWAQKASIVTFDASNDKNGEYDAIANASISKEDVKITASLGSFNRNGYYGISAEKDLTVSTSRGTITRIILSFTKRSISGPEGIKANGYKKNSNKSKDGTWRGNRTSVTFHTSYWLAITKIEVRLEEDEESLSKKSLPQYKFEKAELLTNKINITQRDNELNGVPADLLIKYSIDNANIASIDSTTGNVILTAPGEVTVTASSESTSKYYDYSTSYELKYIKNNTADTGKKKDMVIWSEDFSDYNFANGSSNFTIKFPVDEGFPAANAFYFSETGEDAEGAYIDGKMNSAHGEPNELFLRGGNKNLFKVVIPDLKKAYRTLNLSFLSTVKFQNSKGEYTITAASPGSKIESIKAIYRKDNKGTWYETNCQISIPVGLSSLELVFKALKNSKNARLDNFILSASDFAIDVRTKEGYTTFYSDETFIMPQNLEGTTIAYDNGSMELRFNYEYKGGSTVPAGTPLLIYSKDGEGTFPFNYTTAELVGDNTDNCLHGSVTNETASDVFNAVETLNYYILTYNDNTAKTDLGFYWNADNGEPNFINKAGKAFLAIPKNLSTAKGFSLNSGITDSIDSISLSYNANDATIYTVTGVKVTYNSTKSLQPGIYIVGKKKIIIR